MSTDPPEPTPTTEGDLRVILGFIVRHSLLIGALAVSGTVVALLMSLGARPRFEASTTLLVDPPAVASQLDGQWMSVRGYQRILDSDEVVDRVRQELSQSGDQSSSVSADALRSRIFVADDRPVPLAPVMELSARAATAEEAALRANAWADIFIQHLAALFEGSREENAVLVEALFQDARQRLEDAESLRLKVRTDSGSDLTASRIDGNLELERIRTEGHRRIAAHQAETETLIADHQLETRALMEEASSPAKVEAILADLPANVDAADIRTALRRLASLRAQLAQTLDVKPIALELLASTDTVTSTITDISTNSGLLGIASEIFNPLYTDLAHRTSDLQTELEVVEGSGTRMRRFLVDLERQQRVRGAGLKALTSERKQALESELQRTRTALDNARLRQSDSVDKLEAERQQRLAQADRRVEIQLTLVNDLRDSYSQVALAREEDRSSHGVRVATRAIPPTESLRQPFFPRMVLAALVGGLVGCVVGLFRDVRT